MLPRAPLPSPLEGEGGERSEPGEGYPAACSKHEGTPHPADPRSARIVHPLPQGERVSERGKVQLNATFTELSGSSTPKQR